MQIQAGWAVCLLAVLAARPAAAALTDSLDFSNPASVASHRYEKFGDVSLHVVGDTVGQNDERRMALEVFDGASITFELKIQLGKSTTLEFEEMYGRDSLVRAYDVLVDGVTAVTRTWEGCGAGAVHHFVQLPPASRNQITVTLKNRGSAPFAISRVWAFSDFPAWFDANKMAVPYYIAPLAGPTFQNEKADLEQLNSIKRSLGRHPNIKPAFTVAIGYAAIGPDEVKRRIEWVLRLARLSKMPVQLQFDTWWAQTPSGLDGKGGQWSDVAYIQVVHNATKKQYELSVPNRWSSTPWLTVNNGALNAYKVRRLSEALRAFRAAYHTMLANGQRDLVLAVNLDNEPVYWANGNAGLGEDLLQADFNPTAVAAAKKDGVVLDPTDGLSQPERLWLSKNLAGYNGMVADAVWTGLDRDATVASPGNVRPAEDLLRYNVYTQAMVGSPDIQYPMLDAAWPFWETGAPLKARVGGEWNGDTIVERQAIIRQLVLGRNAGVNAECSNDAANMQSVKPGYALGQRYIALYNYPLDRMDIATAGIRDISQPFKPFVFQPVVREERFLDDTWKERAVEHGGLQSGIIGNTAAVAIYPVSTESPGYITWRLDAPGNSWDSLALELDGRAFNFGKTDPAVHVRVLAGPSRSPDGMKELARLHDGSITPADRVDLSPVAKGLKSVYVRLEFHAPTIPNTVLSWCSIYRARFTTEWEGGTGYGWRQDTSLDNVRKQNLLVSWRRDAERAMADMTALKLSPKAARTAYDKGAYAECCRIANRAMCTALPATFVVRGSGTLKPYPLRVTSKGHFTVLLKACSAREVKLSLRSDSAIPVRVIVGGLTKNARYSVLPDGGDWLIRRSTSKRGIVSSGKAGEVTLTAATTPYNQPAAPRTLDGIYAGGAPNGFRLKTTEGIVTIRTRENTVFDRTGMRGKQDTSIEEGDAVNGRLGKDGVAAFVRIASESLEGFVTEFRQVTPFTMPSIAVDNGKVITVSMDAVIHTPGVNKRVREIPLGTVGIKPGDRVRVRVNPTLNRAVEIWVL